MSDFHRPSLPGQGLFEALAHDTDPAEVAVPESTAEPSSPVIVTVTEPSASVAVSST